MLCFLFFNTAKIWKIFLNSKSFAVFFSQPKILLCDEPTSAVDPQTKESILHYLSKINKQFGITIVIVTHEMQLVHKICNRVAVMEQGQVIEEFDLNQPIQQPVKSIISKLLLNDVSTSLKEAS